VHYGSTGEQQDGRTVARMSPAILVVIPGLEREHRQIGRLLEDEGCLVFEATNAERALKLMNCVTINLVLVCQDRVPVDQLAESTWRVSPRTHFMVIGGSDRADTGWSDSYVRRPVTSRGMRERIMDLICGMFAFETAT